MKEDQEIEIKPIDKWNSRALIIIIFGFVFYQVAGRFLALGEASKPDMPADLQWALYGVLLIAGILALSLSMVFSRVFYQFMAFQRIMIDEVWKLIKRAWELR